MDASEQSNSPSPSVDRKLLLREIGVRDSHILDLKRALAEQSGEIGDTAFSARHLKYTDDSDTPESGGVSQQDQKNLADVLSQQNQQLSTVLEHKLSQLRSENRELSSRCEILEKEERALAQSLNQAEQKKQKAEHALKDHLREANTDLNLAMKELEAVKHRLNEKDALLKTLRDKADLADALMADVEKLRREVDAFRTLQMTKENTVQADRLSFQAKIRELEDALQRERLESRDLLQMEKKNSGRSTTELRSAHIQLKRKTSEVIHYKRLSKVWQKEAKRNHEEIQHLVSTVRDQEKILLQMKKQLSASQQALDEEKMKSEELKAELEILGDEFDKEISELQASIERLQERTRRAEVMANEEHQLRKDLEDRLRNVLRSLNDLEREKLKLGSRLAGLEGELQRASSLSLRSKAVRLKLKQKLRDSLQKLVILRTQHETDMDLYRRERDHLQQNLQLQNEQIQNLSSLVHWYKNRLLNADRQLQSLRQKALNIYDHERVLNKVILTSEGTLRSMRLQLRELKFQVCGEHEAHDVIESATRNLLDDLKIVKLSLRESKAKVRSRNRNTSKDDYGKILYQRTKHGRSRPLRQHPRLRKELPKDNVVSVPATGE